MTLPWFVETNIQLNPGVGVTKPISSVPLFSQIFFFVKTHFNC